MKIGKARPFDPMTRLYGPILFLLMFAGFAQGQLAGISQRSPAKKEPVRLLYPEQITLRADKTRDVALHFRIAEGLHINSNKPGGEYLIPTLFTIPVGAGVTLDSAQYPDGTDFSPAAAPSMKLNVYTGEFVIHAKITAQHGQHLVEAQLRYQACDENACMPPKTVTVPFEVIAR